MGIAAARPINRRGVNGQVLSSASTIHPYKGFTLRSSGSGYQHIYYGETLIKAGVRTITEAKREADKLAHIVEGLVQ